MPPLPSHPQGALQDHLPAVQQHAVPLLLQRRPAPFDQVVLALHFAKTETIRRRSTPSFFRDLWAMPDHNALQRAGLAGGPDDWLVRAGGCLGLARGSRRSWIGS